MLKNYNKYTLITGLIIGAFISTDSFAGFQFKAAPVQSQQPVINGNLLPLIDNSAPSMPAVPTQPVSVIWNKPEIKFTDEPDLPAIPSLPNTQSYNQTPQKPQTTPQPKNEIIASPINNNKYDLAVGFGKDLPLAIALQQIIPGGFNHALDNSADENKLVSWEGGQEWPTVLKNMLDDAGYSMNLDGTIVRISSSIAPSMSETKIIPAMPTPAPAPAVASLPTPSKPEIVWEPTAPMVKTEPSPASISNPIATQEQNDNLIPSAPAEIMQETFIEQKPLPVQNVEKIYSEQPSTAPLKEAEKEVSEPQWIGQKGMSLRAVLESWADLENVDLFWSSDFDFILAGDVSISGDFQKATETILAGFSEANPRPSGRLHPNLPDGPAVLVIETRQSVQ